MGDLLLSHNSYPIPLKEHILNLNKKLTSELYTTHGVLTDLQSTTYLRKLYN